jgi:hypothetical protein
MVFQIGDGTTTNRLTPVDATALESGVQLLAVGGVRLIVVVFLNTVLVVHLALFTNSMQSIRATTAVTTWPQSHCCAILSGETIKCWGSNYYGQVMQHFRVLVTLWRAHGLFGCHSIACSDRRRYIHESIYAC